MAPLPRANAKRHIKAFKRDGWRLVRTTGSHYIFAKDGVDKERESNNVPK